MCLTKQTWNELLKLRIKNQVTQINNERKSWVVHKGGFTKVSKLKCTQTVFEGENTIWYHYTPGNIAKIKKNDKWKHEN